MTETTKAATKPATKSASKAPALTARLDYSKSYGYIIGPCPDCARAKITQDGMYFDLRGKQVGVVPDQTIAED